MLIRVAIAATLAAVVMTSCGQSSADYRGWPGYGGGPESMKYSALDQVNRDNVSQLEVAWTYDSGDSGQGSQIQCNPIMVDGVLYGTTPTNQVFALNASTGDQLWIHDPAELGGRGRMRGLMFWTDGAADRRIYSVQGSYLFALDANTGKSLSDFGFAGRVDLREGLGRPPETLSVGSSTPGVVYKDLLIMGSRVSESLPAAPGDIRAFDARTGEIRWTFHTVPRPGEFGYETWPEEAWQHTGGVNNWSGMALDVERGIAFVPTGTASQDFYGGDRLGDNLFGNSLIALNADTGERIWHFQFVKHDLWDRDLPTAPSLVTVQRDGQPVDAVAQVTKSGHVFVFNRETGEPLFPIEYAEVPPSDVPGEQTAATQPLPTKPPAFARQILTEDILSKRTPEVHAALVERFRGLRSAGQWVPPSAEGTVFFPGLDGGDSYGGAAFDPQTAMLYVNANEQPWILQVGPNDGDRPRGRFGRNTAETLYQGQCAACHGQDRTGSPPDLPGLVGIGSRRTTEEIVGIVRTGLGRMPGFTGLTDEAVSGLAEWLVTNQDRELESTTNAPAPMEYRPVLNSKFLDADGFPAVEPPWGTLNAIDLNSGEIAWQVPLGEIEEVAADGLTNTGSQNFGGPAVTAGGLVFVGATTYDEKFRAFDKTTGELLWETKLPAGNFATPAVYEVAGRQYIVVAAGGGRGKPSAAKYVAFALPQD